MNDLKVQAQYTDTEIIQEILHGQKGLFEILIRRNNPLLYKTGRSYGYNHEDTQDLMQDSFIDAFRNLAQFEGRSSFKSWIIRIMLRNCYRKRLKFSFKNEISNEINEKSTPIFTMETADPGKTAVNHELSRIIENALVNLPEEYRMVFSLREMSGLSGIETAESLGISEGNVRIRLNRAKALLRKEIEKSYTAQDIFEFNLIYCDRMVEQVMKIVQKL